MGIRYIAVVLDFAWSTLHFEVPVTTPRVTSLSRRVLFTREGQRAVACPPRARTAEHMPYYRRASSTFGPRIAFEARAHFTTDQVMYRIRVGGAVTSVTGAAQ